MIIANNLKKIYGKDFVSVNNLSFHIKKGAAYNKVADWGIYIYRSGRGENGKDLVIVNVSDCDMELCFALQAILNELEAMGEKAYEPGGGCGSSFSGSGHVQPGPGKHS